MTDYRICLFDLAGYTASVGIAARLMDARQLMALATRALPAGHRVELWSGERCLAKVSGSDNGGADRRDAPVQDDPADWPDGPALGERRHGEGRPSRVTPL